MPGLGVGGAAAPGRQARAVRRKGGGGGEGPGGVSQLGLARRIESGHEHACRSDAVRERLPPVLEGRVLVADGERGVGDLAQPGCREQLGQVTFAGAGELRLIDDIALRARAPPSRTPPSGPVPPAWSQTQAATTPPGRVTRAISAIPATGSGMKWTTSCARTTSKEAAVKGIRSADATSTSTPGLRERAAATNGSDGSTAETALGPSRPDELGRERARPAADVKRALA